MRIARNHKQMSTHMPVLMKVIPQTTGAVCELGAGMYSTPLLHWLCLGRTFYTYEDDPEYLHYAHKFQTAHHRVRQMSTVDYERDWAVVFIDHHNSPVKRGEDAVRFKNAQIIVLHDSEEPENYGYDKIWDQFKYRKDYTEHHPYTTVVSNTVDVTQWN